MNWFPFLLKRQSRVVCADGTSLSVQAGWHAYCHPRDDEGPYTHVEVGFPSIAPPFVEYADDPENPTNSVYAYVPAQLVLAFIDAHGGIVDGNIPEIDSRCF